MIYLLNNLAYSVLNKNDPRHLADIQVKCLSILIYII